MDRVYGWLTARELPGRTRTEPVCSRICVRVCQQPPWLAVQPQPSAVPPAALALSPGLGHVPASTWTPQLVQANRLQR